MRRASIANELRNDMQREVDALSPAERIELALRLGDESLEQRRARTGLSLEEARREHARSRQAGRRPCGCIAALLA